MTDEGCSESGMVCGQDKICRTVCGSDSDCIEGTSCNSDIGYCQCDEPTCPEESSVFCAVDDDCGRGLFCDTFRHMCKRECGFIVNRGSTGELDETLERPCSGGLKVCQYDRGKCETVDISEATCGVDSDCPNGAYCFIGRCEPKCYSSIQCPDSNWYCTQANTCMPVPPVVEDGVDPFDPFMHSILFSQRTVTLTGINNEIQIPVLIMNLKTRKQVFDQPNVVFGYRLEVSYEMKQETKCTGDFDALSADDQKDCIISEDEEFITLEHPFGTIYGTGDPSMNILLNTAAVDKLSPGFYKATMRAIFNNGNSDEVTVTFQKESPNGEYLGTLKVYKRSLNNLIGQTNLALNLYIDMDAPQVEWDELLRANNIYEEKEYIDVTTGYPVSGYIDGNNTLMFNQPGAHSKATNQVPLKGIYSVESGRLRLTTVIDLGVEPNDCVSEEGGCTSDDNQLQVRNVFGRKVRRLIEFIGTFDFQNGRYSGGYRETISGFAPADTDITLEGEFYLRQTQQDDTPIEIEAPLAPVAESVGFPDLSEVLVQVELDIDTYCVEEDLIGENQEPHAAEAVNHFSSKETFLQYLDSYDIDGPIFPEMIHFEGEVGRALNELEDDPEEYLTLAEFLKGSILFCPEEGEITDSCVYRRDVMCGLSLYRKALLSPREDNGGECENDEGCDVGFVCGDDAGVCVTTACESDDNCADGFMCDYQAGKCRPATAGWVALESIGDSGGSGFTLFCPEVSLDGSDCLTPATENPALVVLQEHNRFYKELVQTLAYQAGNDLSDAFYTLYKAHMGDELDADSAHEHKELRLYSALENYDNIREQFFSAQASAVAFQWPMHWFAGVGTSWFQYMETITSDRLDALSDLIDLKRRINQDTDEDDYMFVQHLLHEEYLTQVFLFVLQEQWQETLFAYAGESMEMLDKGSQLLFKVDENRNPLGFHPSRVFFENSDLSLNNWQNYRNRLGSELVNAESAVNGAITNLKAALSDQDNLEVSLQQAAQAFDANLEQLCGADEELPTECNIGLSVDEREIEMSCIGDDCLFDWTCASPEQTKNDCEAVTKAFTDGVDEDEQHVCQAEARTFALRVNNDDRLCVRGQMGTLIQESEMIDIQREQVYKKVELLLRQIARTHEYYSYIAEQNDDLIHFIQATGHSIVAMQEGIRLAEHVFEMAYAAAQTVDCVVIGGFAFGTDCPQSVASGTLKLGALVAKSAVTDSLSIIIDELQLAKEVEFQKHADKKELAQLSLELDNQMAQVENYVHEYELLTQQKYTTELQIADTYYIAKQTAARYNETVGSIVHHLVGRETGSVLLRNALVKESNERFQEVLYEAYKMAQAFIYRYNLGAESASMVNQVYRLQTIDEVQDFIEQLTDREADYCGAQGLDCDNKNNQMIFKLSLRDALYPNLQDIIDPSSGGVLTKGERFHNEITSSMRRIKRRRASGVYEQIELPIRIMLQKLTGAPVEDQYMLSPEECNHFIVGQRNGGVTSAGTIAVNVFGTRLTDDIKYEFWRNATDYVRSCDEKLSDFEYKINTYTAGWAPQHAFGKLDNPDSFLTHSTMFTACKNNLNFNNPNLINNEDSCFNYFARGRSLSTQDMRLVIPFVDGEQSWILGEGLPDDEKPIIEDIVLYFRYNSQPIYSDGL